MENQDILKHLIDIEQRASLLLSETRSEFEKRIAAVKKEAEAKFERDYEERAKELDRKLSEEKTRIRENYESSIAEYVRNLETLSGDETGLRRTVDAILSKNG